jgi:hypothetical protein
MKKKLLKQQLRLQKLSITHLSKTRGGIEEEATQPLVSCGCVTMKPPVCCTCGCTGFCCDGV